MSKEQQEKLIKETTQEMLDKMGFDAKVIVTTSLSENNNKKNMIVEIDSPDSKFIIGKQGATLMALQHILKQLVRSKTDDYISFSVDVNGYKRQQEDYIRDMAQDVAREVVLNGRASTLEPMNSYERRLVHLELEKNSKVKTESIGEGEDRKIIISPANNA